jgi:hypothetical protein
VDKVIHFDHWKGYFQSYEPKWHFYECDEYQQLIDETGFEVNATASREIANQFPSQKAFSGFLRQWFPYLTQIPTEEEKEIFLKQVVDQYAKTLGLTSKEIPFNVRRLNVVAEKI